MKSTNALHRMLCPSCFSNMFLESHEPRLPARAGRCLGKGGFRSAAQEAAAGDTWRFFLHGFFMALKKHFRGMVAFKIIRKRLQVFGGRGGDLGRGLALQRG